MSARAKYSVASFLFGVCSLLLAAGPAAAFDPVGGPGGGVFPASCPANKYLIGVNAKTGAVVDQISIICGALKGDGTIGDVSEDKEHPHGGNGGSPLTKRACGNSEIIHGLGIVPGTQNGSSVVRMIIFDCVSTTSAARHNLDVGTAPFFPNAENTQPCPAGQAAVGLKGRSGAYLDAVAIECGALPATTAGPGPGPVTPPTGDPCSAAPDSEAKSLCEEHNKRRAMHAVPALTWDAGLTSNAQAWVDQCRTAKNSDGDEFFCHQGDCGPGNPFGENLSFHYGEPAQTPANVVEGWYCEINAYDFDNPVWRGGGTKGCGPEDNPDKVNGHFTQVVWKDSAKLGCAKKTCSLGGNEGTLWACEYDPPGNFNVKKPGVLQNEVPRKVQGFVAGHSPGGFGAIGVPRQTTTAIISDVDLYDVPGGVGRVIGVLRQGQRFPLVGCRPDDWCQLSVGWVWGSFIMRSHNMGISATRAKLFSER
ncbi:hypothetical protein IVB40_08875 [Bradyrhizobium sp. 40]|uniref:CAP domain-containing protein n=1 Tax=Bradyrhizobium sp. 40 TaxID=2782674 RepID=UPI001FFEEE6B|nr:CAP domain-containing protein [Bradyrhizobium sp. 40]UPJ44139.1 hypothetical protein IVB40_08875 [Bradyrhizobium sp. 40]